MKYIKRYFAVVGDLFKWVTELLRDNKIPTSRKIIIPTVIILGVFFVNNYYGITYYLSGNLEVDHLIKLHNAKEICSENKEITAKLDAMVANSVNRKNVFRQFMSLFQKTSDSQHSSSSEGQNERWYNKWLPEWHGSPFWHTISSAPILVIMLILLALVVLLSPFISREEFISLFFVGLLVMGLIALLIWVTQWLFSFIPIFFNRAYINYILYILFNVFVFGLIYKKNNKKNKSKENRNNSNLLT